MGQDDLAGLHSVGNLVEERLEGISGVIGAWPRYFSFCWCGHTECRRGTARVGLTPARARRQNGAAGRPTRPATRGADGRAELPMCPIWY
jgi:hypothetical protein